jgi:multidrug efflux pump subunit AcrA (membrane-fusion protein)
VTVDVIEASNKVEIRQIVIGIQTATDAEVLSGLKEGDLVVVSDRSSLKGGQVVQPKPVDLMQYRSPEEQR